MARGLIIGPRALDIHDGHIKGAERGLIVTDKEAVIESHLKQVQIRDVVEPISFVSEE